MDQGWAVVTAAVISFVGGSVLGGIVQGRIFDSRAEADRVRDERLRSIEETETVVAVQYRAMRDILASRSGLMTRWHMWKFRRAADQNLRADLVLIGDLDAFVALYDAYLRIMRKFPTGRFRPAWLGLVLAFRRPWTDEDLAALEEARSMCLAALRRQRERVLRDQGLATVDPKQAEARLDLGQMQAALARLEGRADGKEKDQTAKRWLWGP